MTPEELEVWKELNDLDVVKKVRGEHWMDGDLYITYQTRKIKRMDCGMVIDDCDPDVWLPLLFDPIRPERSLMGIASTQYDVEMHYNMGFVFHLCDKITGEYMFGGYDGNRPDLALAKAIIEQEGKVA